MRKKKLIILISALGVIATLLTIATGGREVWGWIVKWHASETASKPQIAYSKVVSAGYSPDEAGFLRALSQPDPIAIKAFRDAKFSWHDQALCIATATSIQDANFAHENLLRSLGKIQLSDPKFGAIKCRSNLSDKSFPKDDILSYLLKATKKSFEDGLVRGNPDRARQLINLFAKAGAPTQQLKIYLDQYIKRVSLFANRLRTPKPLLSEICMAAAKNRWQVIERYEPIFGFIQPRPGDVPGILHEVRQRLGGLATFPGAYDVMVEKFCRNTRLTTEFKGFLEWLKSVYQDLGL